MGFAQLRMPTACFVCIDTFAHRVSDLNPDDAGAKFLALKCPSFLTAIMRFLSEDWTESRRATASASLRRACAGCRKCNPAGRAIDGRTAFALTCSGLAIFPVLVLKQWMGQKGKGNPYANRHGRWPTSPEELFPTGPTQTVTTLLTLIDDGVGVERVLLCVLSVDRPLTFPAISSSPNRERFIAIFFARWRAAASAIASDLAKLRTPVIPDVRDRIADRHIPPLQNIGFILLSIFSHPDHGQDDGLAFVHGHEEDLARAMDPVLSYLKNPKTSHELLSDLAINVWYCVLMRRGGDLGGLAVPSYIRAAEDDALRKLDDPYLTLRSLISEQTVPRSCHARHCAKPVHEKETSGAYACCAACRVAKYCSKECQRADWGHALYPHKAVCPMLRELFSFADMNMSSDEFAARCRARGFPLGHVDRLIEWAKNRGGKETKVVSDFEHGNGLKNATRA